MAERQIRPCSTGSSIGGTPPLGREFVERDNPLLTTWCRRMRLDAETADELCQRIWIELARRIASFRYDPSKTFRGWLRRLLYSRTVDLLCARRTDPLQLAEDERSELLERLNDPSDSDEGEESTAAGPLGIGEAGSGLGPIARRTADVAGLLVDRRRREERSRNGGGLEPFLRRRLRRPQAGRAAAPGGGTRGDAGLRNAGNVIQPR